MKDVTVSENVCVSALPVNCSSALTGFTCLLSPSCLRLDLKYCSAAYFCLSLEFWLLPHGRGKGLCQSPRSRLVLPLLAAVTRGHCACEQRFVFPDADTVCWQSLTAYKPLCAATRIDSALKTKFGIRRIELKRPLQLEGGAMYRC